MIFLYILFGVSISCVFAIGTGIELINYYFKKKGEKDVKKDEKKD